jgi:hypothetical protein
MANINHRAMIQAIVVSPFTFILNFLHNRCDKQKWNRVPFYFWIIHPSSHSPALASYDGPVSHWQVRRRCGTNRIQQCLAHDMGFSSIVLDFLASYGWRTLFFTIAAHRFLGRVASELRLRDRARLAKAAVEPTRVRALDSRRASALNTLVERHQSVIAVEQDRLAAESRDRRDRAAVQDLRGGSRLGGTSQMS